MRRATDGMEHFRIVDGLDTLDREYHIFHYDTLQSKLWMLIEKSIWTYDIEAHESQKIFEGTLGKRFAVIEEEDGRIEKIYALKWMTGAGIEIINLQNNIWKKREINEGILSTARVLSLIHI